MTSKKEIKDDSVFISDDKDLIKIKNRLSCPNDASPLFSIVEERLENYEYKIICRECNSEFHHLNKKGEYNANTRN